MNNAPNYTSTSCPHLISYSPAAAAGGWSTRPSMVSGRYTYRAGVEPRNA